MNRPPQGSNGQPREDRSPFDWANEAGLGRELAKEIRAETRRRQRRRVLAGTAALMLGVLIWTTVDLSGPGAAPDALIADYTISAPTRQTLPDGSVVELKDGAAIVDASTPEFRRVILTRGEAHFKVMRDSARPFVVVAAGIEVRAVGTAFSVGHGAALVDVVVTEGRVSVSPSAIQKKAGTAPALPQFDHPSSPVLLDAGHLATVATTEAHPLTPVVSALSSVELEDRLRWRVPLLEFSDTPLYKVVQLFAEHGHVHLTLGDPGLSNLRISGMLRANNVDALLLLLARDHAVTAEHRATDVLLVRRD